jgi:hypothetical protein
METATPKKVSLGGVFFAPNFNSILPLVVEAEQESQFSNVHNPDGIVARIVRKYYIEYCTSEDYAWTGDDNFGRKRGDFNLKSLSEEVVRSVGYLSMVDFFKRPSYYGVHLADQPAPHAGCASFIERTCEHANKDVFAAGRLLVDTNTSDSDCYETAGGYRSFIGKAGTPVYFALNGDNSIVIMFDSSCMVDHYNNNFFGNKTGGGTSNYKEGERVEVRTINTGLFDLRKVLEQYKLSLKYMDTVKGALVAGHKLSELNAK